MAGLGSRTFTRILGDYKIERPRTSRGDLFRDVTALCQISIPLPKTTLKLPGSYLCLTPSGFSSNEYPSGRMDLALPRFYSSRQPAEFHTPSAAPTAAPADEFSSGTAQPVSHQISRSRATTSPIPSAPCRRHPRAENLRVSQFPEKTFSHASRESAPRRPPAGASDLLISPSETRLWHASGRQQSSAQSNHAPVHHDRPSC